MLILETHIAQNICITVHPCTFQGPCSRNSESHWSIVFSDVFIYFVNGQIALQFQSSGIVFRRLIILKILLKDRLNACAFFWKKTGGIQSDPRDFSFEHKFWKFFKDKKSY